MLTPQEGQELRDKADAVGNSIAAGESAANISDTLEAFKSAVVTMTEEVTLPHNETPTSEETAEPSREFELETSQ